MKRLFFALWPDDETRDRCQQIVHAVRRIGRPVANTNLHITLVFLGSVDEEKQAAMSQAAANIAVQPMTIMFDRMDYWKRPRVVCLSTTERLDPAVTSLVQQLTHAAIQHEIGVDKRPYQAHVTLLRKAKSLPEIEFEPIIWRADAFCLVESCTLPSGVEYRVLERWACANPAAAD